MIPHLTTTTTTINTNDNILVQQNTSNINNMDNSKIENFVPYDQYFFDSLQSVLYDQSAFNTINNNNNSNNNNSSSSNNNNSNVNINISNISNASHPNTFNDNFNVTDAIIISNYLSNPTLVDLLPPRTQSPQNNTNMKTYINGLIDSNNNNTNNNNNRVIPLKLEEPTTNLDDLIKDITSDSNNNNIITDNDLFLNNSFLNVDDGIRRHSDAFLTNDTLLPSNMSTSRASISHQLDMWNGLQSNANNMNKNNSNKNSSTSLRKMASLNNSSNNMQLRTQSNRQLDTNNNNTNNNNVFKPSDNFNTNIIKFIDPFSNNNNNNNNSSSKYNSTDFIRPPLKRAVTSVNSTDNIHQVSSPTNERRYSIRKAPYRSSVPTIDINILKELSNPTRMTPLGNVSTLNDRFYNNLDDSLSSSNLIPVTGSVSETVSELSKSNPPSTESSCPFDNSLIQTNNGQTISPYSNGKNYSNNNNYDHSCPSLPQRTVRSASVASIDSNVEKFTQALSLQTVTPSSVKYINMSNNAYMEKISPISTNHQQQQQQQQMMSPSQMNQNLNQYSISQMSQFRPPSKGVMNENNDPLAEQQYITNSPIQPMLQSTSIPSINEKSNTEPHSRNPPGYQRTSITIVQPSKKKNLASNLHKEKIFQCEYCEKSFKRAEHRKRHIRSIHTQERPFACQLCDKKFSRSDNLQQHLKVHKKHELEAMKKI